MLNLLFSLPFVFNVLKLYHIVHGILKRLMDIGLKLWLYNLVSNLYHKTQLFGFVEILCHYFLIFINLLMRTIIKLAIVT